MLIKCVKDKIFETRYPQKQKNELAGRQGIEPRRAELQSAVLPL